MDEVSEPVERPARPCWWSISEDELLRMMRRCHAGEDPEIVYMEEYASADIEQVNGED